MEKLIFRSANVSTAKKFLFKFYAMDPYAQYITNLFHFNFCINFNVSNVMSSM